MTGLTPFTLHAPAHEKSCYLGVPKIDNLCPVQTVGLHCLDLVPVVESWHVYKYI